MLDFDGTLAEIVVRPELARPVEGARDAIASIAGRYRTVAIVTGRRSDDVAVLLDVPHVSYLGLYGFEDQAPELVAALASRAERAAAVVPNAWVEDKGASIAVHYRQAPDPVSARADLIVALQPIASDSGLDLVEGKMVVELVPSGRPMKGDAVERVVREHDLRAALAGDDHADLDAFDALDRLSGSGIHAVRVAVRGEETPPALIDAADLVAEGPHGLVVLLRAL